MLLLFLGVHSPVVTGVQGDGDKSSFCDWVSAQRHLQLQALLSFS